jgi:hypothetical protein
VDTNHDQWDWLAWHAERQSQKRQRELDRVVRAVLSDPPSPTEREEAVAFLATLRRMAALDPARVAAGMMERADSDPAAPPADTASGAAAMDALDADIDTKSDLGDFTFWLQTAFAVFDRLLDARMTHVQAHRPEAWQESGLLGPWGGPFAWHDQDREVLSLGQAAARLGVHPNTLRSWSDKGLVPTIRLPSGRRRYTVAAIDGLREQMGLSPDPRHHG